MRVLLHTCCGPCSIVPLRGLREEGIEAAGVYVNPNIHPYTEWARRRETLEAWAGSEGLRLLPAPEYDPQAWFQAVTFREGERCRICYHLRLRHAAVVARRGRFDGFTSTLLYSRYQNHDQIRGIARAVASEVGVRFLYRDWREGWSDGVRISRELGMYRQGYCGCLYSERERYAPGKEGGRR